MQRLATPLGADGQRLTQPVIAQTQPGRQILVHRGPSGNWIQGQAAPTQAQQELIQIRQQQLQRMQLQQLRERESKLNVAVAGTAPPFPATPTVQAQQVQQQQQVQATAVGAEDTNIVVSTPSTPGQLTQAGTSQQTADSTYLVNPKIKTALANMISNRQQGVLAPGPLEGNLKLFSTIFI